MGLDEFGKGLIEVLDGDISINGFLNDLRGFIRCFLRAYLAQSLLHGHRDISFGVERHSIMYFWYVDVQS
jgi:hypothetical protein